MAILYISHDLPSVAGICHRIAILHEGKIVECGTREQIFASPQHEYTRRLMAALPQLPLSCGVALKKDAAAGALWFLAASSFSTLSTRSSPADSCPSRHE